MKVCREVLGSRLGIQRLSHGDEESEKRYAGELVTALSVDTPALPSPFHHCAECRHELQIEVRLHVHLRLYKADSGNFNLVCLLRAQSQFSVIVIGIGFKHNYVRTRSKDCLSILGPYLLVHRGPRILRSCLGLVSTR